MQAEPSKLQRNKNNEQSWPGIKYATVKQEWENGIEAKVPKYNWFLPDNKELKLATAEQN